MLVHRFVVLILMAFCILVIDSNSLVQADDAPAIETETMTLVVTAPDGSPVVGAKVQPNGLRSKDKPGNHYGWLQENYGPNPELLTDKNGKVIITYPIFVDERFETGQVTVTIDHPDFVLYRGDQATENNRQQVQLEKGYQLRIFPVVKHNGLKPIKSKLHGLIYDGSARSHFEWKSEKQGTFISPAFKRKKTIGWAVQLNHNPILFSDTIEIDPTQTDDEVNQQKRVVLLKPGYRVAGRIDDSVPRPIKNGRVLIWITPSKRPASWGAMTWQEVTEIKADGTFLFESLPRCEAAQVLALCDGWISTSPQVQDFDILKKGDGKNRINLHPGQLITGTYAQVHRIDVNEPNLKLAMEKTVSIEFRALKPDQTPLANATAWMCPNQFNPIWGATIVGFTSPTHEILTTQNRKSYFEKKMKELNLFTATTDNLGHAVINNVPARSSISWKLGHDHFDMPLQHAKSTNRYRDIDATQSLIPVQEIVMEKKGSNVLGKKDSEVTPKSE